MNNIEYEINKSPAAKMVGPFPRTMTGQSLTSTESKQKLVVWRRIPQVGITKEMKAGQQVLGLNTKGLRKHPAAVASQNSSHHWSNVSILYNYGPYYRLLIVIWASMCAGTGLFPNNINWHMSVRDVRQAQECFRLDLWVSCEIFSLAEQLNLRCRSEWYLSAK